MVKVSGGCFIFVGEIIFIWREKDMDMCDPSSRTAFYIQRIFSDSKLYLAMFFLAGGYRDLKEESIESNVSFLYFYWRYIL